MKYFLVLFLLLFTFSVEGRVLKLDSMKTAGTVFPFNPLDNDTIVVDGDPGVVTRITFPGSVLDLDPIPPGVVANPDTNVFINIDNDTIYFDTSQTGGQWFIRGRINSGIGPKNIRIRKGFVGVKPVSGHGLPVSNDVVFLFTAAEGLKIDSVNAVIDGHSSNVLSLSGSSVYSVVVNGGSWASNSISFDDREDVDGAVIFSGSLSSNNDSFNLWLNNLNVTASPHTVVMAKGIVWITNCTLTTDAVNRRWDSVFFDDGITATIGESADNSYIINARGARGGSRFIGNYLYSGNSRQGSRGILFENVIGVSATDSIVAYDNILDIHAGPSGENPGGVTRVVRARGIDGGTCNYVSFHDNQILMLGDRDIGTPAIGKDGVGLNWAGAPGTNNCHVYNNIVIVRNNSTGANDSLNAVQMDFNMGNNSFHDNTYISSTAAIRYGDVFNGTGATGLLFYRDTFQLDTLSAANQAKKIFVLDGPVGTSTGNIIRDCYFRLGAFDTAIYFQTGGNASSIYLQRTITVYVKDLGNQPVLGASVRVVNNYGQNFNMPLTTAPTGISQYTVTYWYEQDGSSDSMNYKPFTIWAKKGTDSASSTLQLSATTFTDTVQLPISSDAMLNLDSLTINLIEQDYLGENDKIEINNYTGPQSYPDSCKFCWSDNGFPDSSGVNCISHTYDLLHKFTDTITPAIYESDTLYISSWVYHADSTSGRATYFKYFDEPASCSTSVSSINFGNVNVGSYKDTTITIKNIGGNTISGTISLSCTGFSIISGGGSLSLQDQQTRVVTIRFAPASGTVHNCSFTPDSLCSSINLTGTGVATSPGEIPTGFRGIR